MSSSTEIDLDSYMTDTHTFDSVTVVQLLGGSAPPYLNCLVYFVPPNSLSSKNF